MRHPVRRLLARATPWIVIAALLPLACGRRGAPIPPRRVAPAAVESVRAGPRDTDILVSWVRPVRNEDGSPLTDLAEFRLSRAVGAAVPGSQPAFSLLATIHAEQPDNATVQGNQYAYRDAGSPPLRGYNLYRGVQPHAYGTQPINAAPVIDTRFRDAGLTNETTYYYVVRSVAGERPPWRESANSNGISAAPMDLTPPAPPRGLAAVPVAGAVALSWDINPEADLLGYVVYRREPPALTPARLTEAPIQSTTFTDRTARPRASYLYSVTAVDRSPRRNESAPSAEAPASLP